MPKSIALLLPGLAGAVVAIACSAGVQPAETTPPSLASQSSASTTQWHAFQRRDFQLGGRDCTLVLPAKPTSGNPWIWRMEFFGLVAEGDQVTGQTMSRPGDGAVFRREAIREDIERFTRGGGGLLAPALSAEGARQRVQAPSGLGVAPAVQPAMQRHSAASRRF